MLQFFKEFILCDKLKERKKEAFQQKFVAKIISLLHILWVSSKSYLLAQDTSVYLQTVVVIIYISVFTNRSSYN